jgi:chemotaxis protein MotD
MTLDIGSTLPVSPSSKAPAQRSAKSGDASFHDILAGDTGKPKPERSPLRPRHAAAHHPALGHGHAHVLPAENDGSAPDTKASKADRAAPKEAEADAAVPAGSRREDEKPAQTPPENSADARPPAQVSLPKESLVASSTETGAPLRPAEDPRRPAGLQPSREDFAPLRIAQNEPTGHVAPAPRSAHAVAVPLPASEPAEQAGAPADPPDRGVARLFSSNISARSVVAPLADLAGRQPAQEHVGIASSQSFPVPATPGLDPTISRLVGAIAATEGLSPGAFSAATPIAALRSGPAAAHTLKIELHPAELGVVNARLHLAGGQLSIELAPETQEAYHRLSSDSDAIVRSLRDLGYDVGKVSVLQPAVATMPAPRTDATGAAPSWSRDPSSSQPGQSGGDGGSSRNNHPQRGGDNDPHSFGGTSEIRGSRVGGGLFI